MVALWAIMLRLIGAVIVSFAALFIKVGGSKLKSIKDVRLISRNYFLIFGLFLYVVASVLSIIAYKGGDLSVLLPINSLSYAGSMILAVWVLKEKLSFSKFLGVTLIIAGVIIIVQ